MVSVDIDKINLLFYILYGVSRQLLDPDNLVLMPFE